jgi:A/G-specific adenine glycosylase
MAKRSRPTKDESDYEHDADSDASFAPAVKRGRSKPSTTRKQSKKKARNEPDAELTDEIAEMALEPSARHPVSTHVIAKAEPLREALLCWYAGVHEARGMPWRKPYDPTFGPEERAQRAYEASVTFPLSCPGY